MDEWYKPRNYSHFDFPISFYEANRLVTSEESVSKHCFLPFLRYHIKKSKTVKKVLFGNRHYKRVVKKYREIMNAGHKDSHIYSYYNTLLQPYYEDWLKEKHITFAPIAYRKLGGKCNIHFSKESFDFIKNKGNCIVYVADISDFFGNLDHKILKERWCELLKEDRLPRDHYAIYNSLTKYSYVDKNKAFEALGYTKSYQHKHHGRICNIKKFRDEIRSNNRLVKINNKKCGIPQGTPISATLSNIYMMNFDALINGIVEKYDGYYRRYSDDILIVMPYIAFNEVWKYFHKIIEDHKLSINREKEFVSVANIVGTKLKVEPPLQYLGFTFDGTEIKVREKTLSKFYTRRQKSIKIAKNSAQKNNSRIIYRKKLYSKFTHHKNTSNNILKTRNKYTKTNFYDYIRRSSAIMESLTIRKQMKKHWKSLNKQIEKAESEI